MDPLFTTASMKAITIRLRGFLFLCGFLPAAMQSFAQTDTAQYTLDQCLHYALQHEPTLNEAIIGQSVQRASNAIALAGWLPQANASGNLTHYLQLPTQFVGNPPVKQRTGVVNTFIPNLSVTQAIFSPSLLYAAHASPLLNKAAAQI